MHRNGERQCVGKGQRESERLKKREKDREGKFL